MAGTTRDMTDRQQVSQWVTEYETAWRTPGTAVLAQLFTDDAGYQTSPYEQPIVGLAAIGRMWEAERGGPDEVFVLTSQVVAVDGEVAVVRAEVRYGDPVSQEYRDLWVLRLRDDGHCSWFEEWPYWPDKLSPPVV
jgi:ketosteroid isomerase-like protein